jgi:hypothetical protein
VFESESGARKGKLQAIAGMRKPNMNASANLWYAILLLIKYP